MALNFHFNFFLTIEIGGKKQKQNLSVNLAVLFQIKITEISFTFKIFNQVINQPTDSMKTTKTLARSLKLPAALQRNFTALQMKKYLQILGPSSGFFSCLLYGRNGKLHFLSKDDSFPFISLDMIIYALFRNKARTIITSGPTLRKQPNIYNQMRGAYGKKQLLDIYDLNYEEPFNLLVYTMKMKDEEIKPIICEKYFKHVSLKNLGPVKNFKEIAEAVNQLGMGPTLYENGLATLGEAQKKVQAHEKNFADMIMLSLFEGSMPQKYIGSEFQTSILSRDFNKVWESEAISSTAKHEDGKEKPISLKFVVYLRKDKSAPETFEKIS